MTDKEKIIAEIERRRAKYKELISKSFGVEQEYFKGMAVVAGEMMLFINSLPAEQPSERLGDEIDHFRCSDIFALAKRAGEEVTATAQHFAQWQKEQVMKGFCFETKVYQDCDGDDIESPFQTWLSLEQNEITALPNLGLSDGDKVKVVIVKEDEQCSSEH